jgi:hypothetical protein
MAGRAEEIVILETTVEATTTAVGMGKNAARFKLKD